MIKLLSGTKEPSLLELGGKGYSLATLVNNGFNIPRAFVIVTDVFFEYLTRNNLKQHIEKLSAEIDENNYQQKSKKIRSWILSGQIPNRVASEVKKNLIKLDVRNLSVRSSAVSEDSLRASFAGLYDTYLNIKADLRSVLRCVKKCWASLFNERAVIYRIKNKIRHLEGIAVIVQDMIHADVSGVTFTVHPTKRTKLLIEASYGVGDLLVCGKVDPDAYTLDRETLEIVGKRRGMKDKMSIVQTKGIRIVCTKKQLAEKQVLCDNKIKEIAKICLKVEKIFSYPQDIEWCTASNKLWLLQSRAISGVTI